MIQRLSCVPMGVVYKEAESVVEPETAERPARDASTPELLFRRPTQARGRAKFDQILDAAHSMIDEIGVEGFSLYDIADRAGVAAGSVYHFFPTLTAIFGALVERYDEEFARLVTEPIESPASWQDILVEQTERSRRFINDHRPAMLLILGPGQTWQSRLIDTVGDTHIAHSMVKAIAEHFVVPKAPDPAELMHRAIRCLESLWQLSFQRHGSVTDEMAVETNKVMIAYLRIYWPELMEPAATQIDAHGADT